MGIKCTTPKSEIDGYFENAVKVLQEEVTRAFKFLGEKCIRRIRDRSGEESWYDQTGNLRSSIGYAVFDYGKRKMRSDFSQILSGSEGPSEGRKLIDRLANQYSNVYALVVVAGMNYAEYVESINGKDVLASTKLWAQAEVNGVMKLAIERAERKISRMRK